jgi:hypothetical protein
MDGYFSWGIQRGGTRFEGRKEPRDIGRSKKR